jgi:NADPH2:quinone reductase
MKPESMRYVAHAPGGGPEVLRIEQGKIPAIGPRDVLIEVFFAGVNRPDLLQRAGEYPPPPDAAQELGGNRRTVTLS